MEKCDRLDLLDEAIAKLVKSFTYLPSDAIETTVAELVNGKSQPIKKQKK